MGLSWRKGGHVCANAATQRHLAVDHYNFPAIRNNLAVLNLSNSNTLSTSESYREICICLNISDGKETFYIYFMLISDL